MSKAVKAPDKKGIRQHRTNKGQTKDKHRTRKAGKGQIIMKTLNINMHDYLSAVQEKVCGMCFACVNSSTIESICAKRDSEAADFRHAVCLAAVGVLSVATLYAYLTSRARLRSF
jgi:hypothetical protein